MATWTSAQDTSTNKDLFKVGSLKEIFDNTSKSIPQYYKELVNNKTTKELEWRRQEMGGTENAGEIVEGQNIPVQLPVIGRQRENELRYFGTGFRMTFIADRYNKYGLWAKWAKNIAKSMKVTKDIEVHKLFNDPANSNSYTWATGYDALALAHNTHTGLLAGSTADNYDNYLNSALSYTSLESARYYFKTLVDSMGQLMGAEPTHLVYQPTLWPTVREMFGSDKKAWEMTNTKNWAGELGLKPYEDPRISSTTRWFVLAKDDDYDINVWTGMEPNFIVKDAPDRTMDKMCMTQQHFAVGFGDQRQFYLGI